MEIREIFVFPKFYEKIGILQKIVVSAFLGCPIIVAMWKVEFHRRRAARTRNGLPRLRICVKVLGKDAVVAALLGCPRIVSM